MKPPPGLRSKNGGGGNYQAALHAFTEASTPEERLALQRAFVRPVLNALGYTTSARVEPLDPEQLPLFAAVQQYKQPHLWVVEAFDGDDTGDDLMTLPAHPLSDRTRPGHAPRTTYWYRLLWH